MAQTHRAADLVPCWWIVEPTRWGGGLSAYIESLIMEITG